MRNMAVKGLAETSEKLLAVVLSCKVRTLEEPDVPYSLVELQKEKEKLLQTQMSIKENLELEEILEEIRVNRDSLLDSKSNSFSRSELRDRKEKMLNDKLWNLKTKYYQDELLLERLQTEAVLLRHLFPSRPSDDTCTGLEEQVDALTGCSLKLLCEVEKVQHMQRRLEEAQQERTGLMLKCLQLNEDIEKKSVLHTSKSMAQLKMVVDRYNLLRHCLQGLIISSGKDWALDEHLLQVMLEVGEPLTTKDLLISSHY